MKNKKSKSRIELIDALRGIAIILMIIHHIIFDAVSFLGAPDEILEHPLCNIVQKTSAITFILLCGVSSNFSKSNIKRGFITAGVALVVTIATSVVKMPVIFGVLHMLAFCMIFYGITRKLWQKIPQYIVLALSLILSVLSDYLVRTIEINSEYLWIFGWTYPGFVSYDYFPLLPWIFVFMTGTALGYYIKEHKFPEWFYKAKIPVLPAIGRHSLIIYVAHQPLLTGLFMLISAI